MTGYDPASAALLLELVEDWRPQKPGPASEAQMEREIAGRITITDTACGEEESGA